MDDNYGFAGSAETEAEPVKRTEGLASDSAGSRGYRPGNKSGVLSKLLKRVRLARPAANTGEKA